MLLVQFQRGERSADSLNCVRKLRLLRSLPVERRSPRGKMLVVGTPAVVLLTYDRRRTVRLAPVVVLLTAGLPVVLLIVVHVQYLEH